MPPMRLGRRLAELAWYGMRTMALCFTRSEYSKRGYRSRSRANTMPDFSPAACKMRHRKAGSISQATLTLLAKAGGG